MCGSLQTGQHKRSVTHTFFWHQQAGQIKLRGASSLAIILPHITRTFGNSKVLSQPEQCPAQCRPKTSTDCLQTGTLAVLLFAFRDLRQEMRAELLNCGVPPVQQAVPDTCRREQLHETARLGLCREEGPSFGLVLRAADPSTCRMQNS